MKKTLILILLECNILLSQSPIPYSPLAGYYSGTYLNGTSVWYGNNATAYQLDVENNAQYTLKASESIHIGPSNNMSNYSNTGYFHAYIDPTVLNIASFHSNGWANIGRFDRFEIGVQLPTTIDQQIESFLGGSNGGVNPYNFNQIIVEADFIYYGNGINAIASYHREGFYYRDISVSGNAFTPSKSLYPFRIRFAPPENGTYLINISLKVGGNVIANFNGAQMSVSETGKRGFLAVGNNRHLKDYHGTSFFALGQNIAFAPGYVSSPVPNDFNNQRQYINDLGNHGGNFFRLRIDPWSNEIELEELGVYGSTRKPSENYQRQWQAFELDQTFKLAENKGMYIFLTLLQDQQFKIATGPDIPTNSPFHWYQNPYHTQAGAAQPEDFFDVNNTTYVNLYKNKVRYIMARYGYSSNLGVISLVNETDKINNYTNAPVITAAMVRQRVSSWIGYFGSVLKTNFYPAHLLTTGFAEGPKNPDGGVENNPNFDIVTGNNYSNSRRVLKMRHDTYPYNVLSHNSNKPFIYGEMGGLCDPNHEEWYSDADFHNNLWASAMFQNSIGTGLYWWDWDEKYLNHRANYDGLNAFFTNSPPDFENENFKSKWDCNVSPFGLIKNRKIEWIANVNSSGTKGFGWVHNSDYFWVNDPNAVQGGLSQFYNNQCYNESGYPGCNIGSWGCDPKGPYGYPQHFEQIVLDNYQGSKGYQVDIYTCYNNYGFDSGFGKNSNIFGKIKFYRLLGHDPLDQVYGQPDFAFKAYRGNIAFRTNDSTYINEKDTEYVSAENPCIKAYGYLDEAKKGSDIWQIDNEEPIKEQSPILCFQKEKVYTVKHSFVDTTGKKITLTQEILILNSKSNTTESIVLKENDIIIYPNPVTTNFIIQSIQNIKTIRIYNNLGQQISILENLNVDKFECNELAAFSKGSYTISMTLFDNTIRIFKLIKI